MSICLKKGRPVRTMSKILCYVSGEGWSKYFKDRLYLVILTAQVVLLSVISVENLWFRIKAKVSH